MEQSYRITIENIVSAVNLGVKIDLHHLVSNVKGIEYNPENFPGAVYRIHEPKMAILIFSSGKVIATGAQSNDDIAAAIANLRAKLAEVGIEPASEPKAEIQNIVASADIGLKVNLDQLAIESFNTEYEPEQFPGLVYRLDDPKTVILVFRSGKLVITGAKRTKDLETAAEKTLQMIMEKKATIP